MSTFVPPPLTSLLAAGPRPARLQRASSDAARPAKAPPRATPEAAAETSRSSPPPRTWRERARLLGHDGQRLLGAAQALGRFELALPHSRLHDALCALGVMDGLPSTRDDPPELDPMPLGRGQMAAPPPAPPPGFDCTWPQQPLVHPGFPRPVLEVSAEESRHHLRKNAARYLGQALALIPKAVWRCRLHAPLSPLDAARFDAIISETLFAQYLSDVTTEEDRAFAASPGEQIVVLDFVPVDEVPTLPGLHVARCRAWLARCPGDRFAVRAVRVAGQVFRPSDGDAWELALYYVLMGANYHLLAGRHGLLHFPGDSINAITIALLPQGHVLYQLLRPFTRFTLGLDKAVLHHRRSVYHNSQREIYSPFAMKSPVILAVTAIGYNGLEGDPYHRPYRFGERRMVQSTYRRFLDDWEAAIGALVAAVVADVPPGDPYVRAWADAIAEHVPGFPGGADIFEGDALARAVTAYIFTVTAHHAGDHHSYATLSVEETPLRLRVPPPDHAHPRPWRRADLQTREDYFRHQLARPMFFAPVNMETIDQVRFGFQSRRHEPAVRAFRARMLELDARWAGTRFPSSRQIACSIQY